MSSALFEDPVGLLGVSFLVFLLAYFLLRLLSHGH